MLLKELIEQLRKFPPNCRVVLNNPEWPDKDDIQAILLIDNEIVLYQTGIILRPNS